MTTPCEHDTLGCGDRMPHDEHAKIGDGRPCCGWPPHCRPATPPADDASEGLSEWERAMDPFNRIVQINANRSHYREASRQIVALSSDRLDGREVNVILSHLHSAVVTDYMRLLPYFAARESAAATRARAEGAAEALRGAADVLDSRRSTKGIASRALDPGVAMAVAFLRDEANR